jgi:hypothetical protein
MRDRREADEKPRTESRKRPRLAEVTIRPGGEDGRKHRGVEQAARSSAYAERIPEAILGEAESAEGRGQAA